jgi:hypothetical protein
MRINRYFLMLAVFGTLMLISMRANPVLAVGARPMSSGCKQFSDQQAPYNNLKVEDSGKDVVVATGLYFDKEDKLILSWEAKNDKGEVLKSTGTLILKDGDIDRDAKTRTNVHEFKLNTTTDVIVKITVEDPANLASISYKITCYSAALQKLERSQPAIWP